jgi:hypothetical protein
LGQLGSGVGVERLRKRVAKIYEGEAKEARIEEKEEEERRIEGEREKGENR